MSFKRTYIPLMLGVAVAIGIFIGGKLNFSDTSDRFFTSNSKKEKLNRLIDYIDYEYIEAVNTDSIVDITVNGILSNLDPHSVYIPKSELGSVTENMKGDFVGIGISFYNYKDTLAVIRPLTNGPSESAGIKSGDRIVVADGDSIFGAQWSNDSIISKLKGEKNTKINLKIFRKGVDSLIDMEVYRSIIPIYSVDAAYMLTNDLGYIKINRFAESTYKEFKAALKQLKQSGATQLALDLRNNPGGFLSVAEQIVDEFLGAGKLILYTKNRSGHIQKSYATSKGEFENGEVYILINEASASASEIVAGALQDNDKGTIVGRRSYGKGLVQREMSLGDGSAVRLTVSQYYTPTGRSIQRSYVNGQNEAYHLDYYKRTHDRNANQDNLDDLNIADSLKFTTPKGKVVYGGGGIIPDVYVGADIGSYNETLEFIVNRGYISYFVFEELDQDRSLYKDMDVKTFINDFEVDDALVKRFESYINFKERSRISLGSYYNDLKNYIKAAIADQLYGTEASEEILSRSDKMIEKVIELSIKH